MTANAPDSPGRDRTAADGHVPAADRPEVPCPSAQLNVLLAEYRQASEDWRLRDDYVERKFMHSTFYFTIVATALGGAAAILGHVAGSEGELDWAIPLLGAVGLGVFAMMAFFTYAMLVSLIKDVAFRDGSQQLMIELLDDIERTYGLRTGRSILRRMRLAGTIDAPCETVLNHQEFPRKVRAHSVFTAHLGIPDWLRDWLRKKHTFEHFVVFHVVALLACLAGTGWMISLLV